MSIKNEQFIHEACIQALEPLAAIADAYDAGGLDEVRPDWVRTGATVFDLDVELYCGRGGRCLLTLRHAMQARFILTGKAYSQADTTDVDEAKAIFNALYIGGVQWKDLSDERRAEFVAKVKVLQYRKK